ncbi:MAG: hypothetical protein ACK5TB_00265, partial [bacterium]
RYGHRRCHGFHLPPEPAYFAPKAASLADHYIFVISLKALTGRLPFARALAGRALNGTSRIPTPDY